jgi:S-DNA-T family DNA segregation ATPase FtsK/SpoIIIE
MATHTVSRQPRRLLPASMEAALVRWCRRGLGLVALSLALAGWLSLLTWSIGDPSLNHITEKPPENLLRLPGAVVADLLIQSLGLASIAVFLPVAALGFRLAWDWPAGPLRLMSVGWLLAAALIAMSLSTVPAPQGWPLVHGLGGIIGDFLMAGSVQILRFVPDAYAQAVAGVVAALAGLAALSASCGLGLRDLAVLLESERARRPRPSTGLGVGTRLGGLMAKRHSAPDAASSGPREF